MELAAIWFVDQIAVWEIGPLAWSGDETAIVTNYINHPYSITEFLLSTLLVCLFSLIGFRKGWIK